jgi:hypothetical protein
MRFKGIFCTGGLFVIFVVIGLFLVDEDTGAQCVPGTVVDYGDRGVLFI